MSTASKLVVWFSEVTKDDSALVGTKGASLGELVHNGFPVARGFIVTTHAYYSFLKENNLHRIISDLLTKIRYDDKQSLGDISRQIKRRIITAKVSSELSQEVFSAYKKLGDSMFHHPFVCVSSLAAAQDLLEARRVINQETFQNVSGEANVVMKIKESWASLFDSAATYFRHEKHFDDFKIGVAVTVQKIVESEKSGVMFTRDPVTNNKKSIVIEAIFGLAPQNVQKNQPSDHYEIAKDTLSIIQKSIATQTVYIRRVGGKNKEVNIVAKHQSVQKMTNEQIIELARLGEKLEAYFYFPQEVTWAIEKKKIYVIQTRPITSIANHVQKPDGKQMLRTHEIILRGEPSSPGIASGPVKILSSEKDANKILPGDMVVTLQTNPHFLSAVKKAAGVILGKVDKTTHASFSSKKLGVPSVAGAQDATKLLKTGMVVSINGNTGEIYKGGFTKSSIQNGELVKEKIETVTKIYVNLTYPESAGEVAKKQVDGVGLRSEFMVKNIGIHPKKMIRTGRKSLYIEALSKGLEDCCQAFSPRPVVYRTTDLKTSEYKNLLGGKDYEPVESNPLLGYHGAFRYIHDPEVFNLELEAIKRVRESQKLKNLWVMIPFVRTVDELRQVKELIKKSGLYRSPTFKLWMSLEVPSNVFLLDRFIEEGIDGVSIGSDDLTALILGTDKDNPDVSMAYNQQNEALLWAFERVIKTTQKHTVPVSLNGRAASKYPQLLEKLVEWGITSVSVPPESSDETRRIISQAEKKLLQKAD